MAFEEKKYLGQAGVAQLIENIKSADEAALQAAKNYAKEYSDSLADNYDAAGTAATKMQELADGQVKLNKEAIEKLNGDANTEGSVAKAIADAKALIDADIDEVEKKADKNAEDIAAINHAENGILAQAKGYTDSEIDKVQAEIGSLENLETTDKDNLVEALNEIRNSVSAGGVAAQITMEESTTGLADGILKAYTIKQGSATVGTINIPKDMVVQSGEVVVDPDGHEAGTYIKLVLANATNDEIYVNVGTLVDIYKAKANAAQIQLAIDSATREISASVVAGSIGTTELADAAVTTVKIADGNVTKAKLSTEVQASLDKADAADANAQGYATTAESNAKAHADQLNTAMNTRVEALEETAEGLGALATKDIVSENELDEALKAKVNASAEANHSHENKEELDKIVAGDKAKWDAAEQNAKDYADQLNTAMDTRVKATEEALAEGGSVETKIATAKQEAIDAAATDATEKANKSLEDAKAYADEKDAEILAQAKEDAANKDVVVLSEAQKSVDAALAEAKTYTDDSVGQFVEISADEIDALFE